MKTKFKYVTLMAVALVMGFSSCGNEDDVAGVDDTPKSVRIHVSNPSTYAEEATADGHTPTLNDLNVYFIGGGVIKEKGTMTAAEVASPAGKTFNNVPGSADKVVIIANAVALASPVGIALVQVSDPEAKLNALMFEQNKQTHPTTAVNVYGTAGIGGLPGAETAAVTLAPAISRIEIAKVEANPAAVIVLNEFKLTGIYINNTYTQCGTDYTTLPVGADILNYGKIDPAWTDGTYLDRFKDEMAPAAGISFTPAVAANKWSYYVMPVIDEPQGIGTTSGTFIDGVKQTSVPHIVLKIEDAKANGYVFNQTTYVTVKDLQVGGLSLTALERGKVYSIANITIGGENLTAFPETPATQDVKVTATLTPWADQPVSPIVP